MTTQLYLSPLELKVLGALSDRHWYVPVELAKQTDLHVQQVRSTLKHLSSRQLVERGGWGDSRRWGEFRISSAGESELAERNQLRLLP